MFTNPCFVKKVEKNKGFCLSLNYFSGASFHNLGTFPAFFLFLLLPLSKIFSEFGKKDRLFSFSISINDTKCLFYGIFSINIVLVLNFKFHSWVQLMSSHYGSRDNAPNFIKSKGHYH